MVNRSVEYAEPFEVFHVPQGMPNGPGEVDARSGWWSRSTGIGNQESQLFPQTEGKIVNITGEDALGPPRPATITLHAQYKYGEGSNCAMRASISVGAGGTTQVVECDWMEGTQLALSVAGQLRISAKAYAPIPGLDYSNANASFMLGASLSLTNGSHPQPRYTQRLLQLAPNAISTLFTPPDWAESVQVFLIRTSEDIADPYTTNVHLRFHDPAGNIFAIVPANRFPQDFVSVPAGSRVSIHNMDPDGPRTPTLVWRLAL